MFGMKATRRKVGKDEAEKPFWISFSDLMTALMVLFLVAMAVTLLAVIPKPPPPSPPGPDRLGEIAKCVAGVEELTGRAEFKGVSVPKNTNTIDFGALVLFGDLKHTFNTEQEQFIRKFVPQVLQLARSKECSNWLKRVVIEGFASQTGGYLFNLNLSYLRSQRVLCALLGTEGDHALTSDERKQVQSLFFVGGSSFNATTGNANKDRRVQLRLEFRDLLSNDKKNLVDLPLDPGQKCPNPN
jgi:outer membrane protein OmpA-like peptidoglycan-associated protein